MKKKSAVSFVVEIKFDEENVKNEISNLKLYKKLSVREYLRRSVLEALKHAELCWSSNDSITGYSVKWKR